MTESGSDDGGGPVKRFSLTVYKDALGAAQALAASVLAVLGITALFNPSLFRLLNPNTKLEGHIVDVREIESVPLRTYIDESVEQGISNAIVKSQPDDKQLDAIGHVVQFKVSVSGYRNRTCKIWYSYSDVALSQRIVQHQLLQYYIPYTNEDVAVEDVWVPEPVRAAGSLVIELQDDQHLSGGPNGARLDRVSYVVKRK